jgi:hypothetical protein
MFFLRDTKSPQNLENVLICAHSEHLFLFSYVLYVITAIVICYHLMGNLSVQSY